MFLFAFFNCGLRMIKVYTPFFFFYSFGNVGTEILRGYFELSLPSKTKSQAQVFLSKWRLATHGKIYCRCNLCGQ